jgi:hypothetical protein
LRPNFGVHWPNSSKPVTHASASPAMCAGVGDARPASARCGRGGDRQAKPRRQAIRAARHAGHALAPAANRPHRRRCSRRCAVGAITAQQAFATHEDEEAAFRFSTSGHRRALNGSPTDRALLHRPRLLRQEIQVHRRTRPAPQPAPPMEAPEVDCDWMTVIALVSSCGPAPKPMRQPVMA